MKLLLAVVVFLPTLAFGQFAPCTLNPLGGFTCDLFETIDGTPGGLFSEIGPVIQLPGQVVPAVWIVCENPGLPCNAQTRTNWSDALLFTNTTVQLFSDGCQSGIEGDTSCFPGPPINFIFESGPPSVYASGFNVYNIWSDFQEVVEIPEPVSFALMGSGLAALAVIRKRRSAISPRSRSQGGSRKLAPRRD